MDEHGKVAETLFETPVFGKEIIEPPKYKRFICDHCGQKSLSKATLIRHLESVHAPRKRKPRKRRITAPVLKKPEFFCDMCGEVYPNKTLLIYHIREIHEGKISFSCDECGRKFSRWDSRRRHMSSVHFTLTFQCNHCEFKSKVQRDLKDHMNFFHLEIKKDELIETENNVNIELKKNQKIVNNTVRQSARVNKKSPEEITKIKAKPQRELRVVLQKLPERRSQSRKRWICHPCNREYSSKRFLERHVNSHTIDKPYICPLCKRAFKIRNQLVHHLLLHTGKRFFNCSSCKAQFNRRNNLDEHRRNQHKDIDLPPIPDVPVEQIVHDFLKECIAKKQENKDIDVRKLLAPVGVKYSPPKGGKYACPLCDKSWPASNSLNIHLLVTHAQTKVYNCDACSFSTLYKRSFLIHRERAHPELEYELPNQSHTEVAENYVKKILAEESRKSKRLKK